MNDHAIICHQIARHRQRSLRAGGAQPRIGRDARSPEQAALAALVRAAAGGDEAAWRSLVDRFTPALRGAARGFRLASADVDDVVQNTWLAAFRNLGRLEKPEAITSWLLVTARRESLLTFQRGMREIATDDPPSPADLETPERIVVETERQDALRAARLRLPARQRALLGALLNAPDASYIEVSQRLEMPIGSIGPTRERALQRLRRDPRLVEVLCEPAEAGADA